MKPVRIGVIGAGYWGPNLIRNLAGLPEAELCVVCDINQARLDHIKTLYPQVYTTRDATELIHSDIEAVVIATPASSHYCLGMDCLNAGKHILVEKPLACTCQEARELVELGRRRGKVVMTGHTFLYNPAVIAVKEIIERGEIGEVYYINSTRVNLGLYHPDVNVVWDLAPHDISILLYILGIAPAYASARGGMFAKAGVHDVAYITLYYPNGIMADLRVSWLDPVKIRRLTIVGSRKMLVYDDIEPVEKVKIYDKRVQVQPYNDTYEEFHLAYHYGDVIPCSLTWEEPLRGECLHFLDAISTGAPVRSDGVQGVQVVQVLEAAQKSLLNGHTKELIAWE